MKDLSVALPLFAALCLIIGIILSSFYSLYADQNTAQANVRNEAYPTDEIISTNSSSKSVESSEVAGRSFGNAMNLSNNIGHSELPQVYVNKNYVYVMWIDDTSGNRDIYFKRSTNSGLGFNRTINLSNNTGGSLDPRMVISGSNVYVVWEHAPGNNGEIYFARSTNYGANFSKSVNIGNNSGFNGLPEIATSKTNVYVVWHDASHGLIFRRSIDNGATFEKAVTLSGKDILSFDPHIATVSGTNNVYLVWITPSNSNQSAKYNINFRRSIDNGATFEKAVTLSRKDILSFDPHIATVSGTNNVHIVWHNGSLVRYIPKEQVLISDVMYIRSTDNGATFDNTTILSNYSGWATNPQIAVIQENDVYVVWQNNPQGKNGEIIFRRSIDNGATFQNAVILSNTTSNESHPQIAVSQENNVYVVWQNNPQGKNGEIIFRRSIDNGATFQNAVILSNTTSNESHPQIAVSQENNVYVVWNDNATGNNEVKLVMNNAHYLPQQIENKVKGFENASLMHEKFRNTANIAVVEPTFTKAAYDKSFYVFYNVKKKLLGLPAEKNVTKYTNMLHSSIDYQPSKNLIESHECPCHLLVKHLKWLLPESNIVRLIDQDVHEGAIFTNGTNKFDVIILVHHEYVTQQEYNNLIRFVANGGTMILFDGNVFYAEVKYDKEKNKISLVKGHGWAFNGKSAWKSVDERWANESSEWIGSNYLCCYGDTVNFANNPFNYTHNEEQYITNPNAKILLDYNATFIKHHNGTTHVSHPKVATYEFDYKKGKVIGLGLYSDDILWSNNERFLRFFDSLLFKYARLH
jgi:BNR repeat-like domain/N,N-dimethylformamidase beta subunit-like, C-terminal